jgi:hypothetical protein
VVHLPLTVYQLIHCKVLKIWEGGGGHAFQADTGSSQAAEKLGILGEIGAKHPSAAKAIVDSVGFVRGLKPPPPSGSRFFHSL